MINLKTISINPGSTTQPPLTRGSQWLHKVHPTPSLLSSKMELSNGKPMGELTSNQWLYAGFRVVASTALLFAAIAQGEGMYYLFGLSDWMGTSAWIMGIMALMLMVGLGGRSVAFMLTAGCVAAIIHLAKEPAGGWLLLNVVTACVPAIFVIGGTGKKTMDNLLRKYLVWKAFS